MKVYHVEDAAAPADAVFVGRPTKWGNPFTIGLHTREEAVARHAQWLDGNRQLIADAKRELRGKSLVCYCAPKACHATALMRVANEDDI